jgi:hypothetical protein
MATFCLSKSIKFLPKYFGLFLTWQIFGLFLKNLVIFFLSSGHPDQIADLISSTPKFRGLNHRVARTPGQILSLTSHLNFYQVSMLRSFFFVTFQDSFIGE